MSTESLSELHAVTTDRDRLLGELKDQSVEITKLIRRLARAAERVVCQTTADRAYACHDDLIEALEVGGIDTATHIEHLLDMVPNAKVTGRPLAAGPLEASVGRLTALDEACYANEAAEKELEQLRASAMGKTKMPYDPLPCPFCGCETITVAEGSTFRWAIGICDNCGASCGEVRVNTMQRGNEEEIRAAVIEEWNKRATEPHRHKGALL